MDRESFAQLSDDEKFALFKSLESRLAELEARLKRPKKTSRNSSIPASQDQKANKRNQKKKRGPKKGHPGKSRQRSEPDVILECSVEQCESCGADLSDVPQRVAGRSQVTELPPIQPMVLEAVVYTASCPCCGEEQRSRYPQGFEPARVFGPNIEAIATYLRQVHHLSYSRLKTVFASLFNFSISEGAIDNILRRVSERVQPAVERIKEIIRQTAVIGSDETRARVDGFNRWEWVFQTPTASYHTVRSNRRHQAITEFMEDARTEIWMSDLFSAQLKGARLCAEGQAMCGAHQLRDLQYAIDCGDRVFALPMRQLFLVAKSLAQRRDEFEPNVYERLVTQVNKTCDQLLEKDCHTAEGIKPGAIAQPSTRNGKQRAVVAR